MNQILVTKKLYITPELKRKRKLYKLNFCISIFLVCVLISFCIYAEYDRNKSEEVSKEILSEMDIPQTDTTVAKSDVLVVVLNNDSQGEQDASNDEDMQDLTDLTAGSSSMGGGTSAKVVATKHTTNDGYDYSAIATINIPKLNWSNPYPVLDGDTDSVDETTSLLKISPTKFWGPDPNEVGNFCIVGHNYRNEKFFSKVPTLETGDIIELTDLSGRTINYRVYNKYEVDPTDVSCTSQLTNGQKEVTLITCTNDSSKRVIVKAREVK